ncbi:MAG TPA: glycine zipper 2TM domain-containing protein, partial [Duganella sp.]|nr:glycine zipper 2TM domain-containing protein [Duganella sp.]
MNKRSILLAITLAALTSAAQAQTPKQHYNAETKRIATRYAEDKKLCAEENESGARMQCLRDAKSEFNKSNTQAKADYKNSGNAKAVANCVDCGRVTSVVEGEKKGEGSAVGLIAGGVAGALLGNQVGSGTGRDLATVAGAVGGAYAGKHIEGKMKTTKVWTVNVRFENGR